jgi:tetratricopeptide (TPR) repeat protein
MLVSNQQLGLWFDQAARAEEVGLFEEALGLYERILIHAPTVVPVILRRGAVQSALERYSEALDAFDRAVALAPDDVDAQYSRATALQALGRLEDALVAYDIVATLDPLHERSAYNRIVVLRALGQFDFALSAYEAGIAKWPEHPLFHFGRSCMLLQHGDLQQGWPGYERRARLLQIKNNGAPIWNGENLQGRRLWLQAEQGLGDTIHFCRYAISARDMGAQVTLHVQPRLQRLLTESLEDIAIGSTADDPPSSDYQSLLLSMPGRLRTTLETIPFPGHYLKANAERVSHWKHYLGDGGFKIGIVWQGERTWQGKTKAGDIGRSLPLAVFSGLTSIPGVRLISLQKSEGVEQLAWMPDGMNVETLGPTFDEGADGFLDSAAVMACCDLVITSDTAIAHLAGATGTPVWLALQYVPEWRWFLGRADSPWYRSMRLFRQASQGDWPSVFEKIRSELMTYVDCKL